MAKEHKKLYKAGKNWLVATLFAVAAGTALATTSVHAYTTTDQGQNTVAVQQNAVTTTGNDQEPGSTAATNNQPVPVTPQATAQNDDSEGQEDNFRVDDPNNGVSDELLAKIDAAQKAVDQQQAVVNQDKTTAQNLDREIAKATQEAKDQQQLVTVHEQVNYVATDGQTVGTQTLTGQPGQQFIAGNLTIPTGYKLEQSGSILITLGDSDGQFTVQVVREQLNRPVDLSQNNGWLDSYSAQNGKLHLADWHVSSASADYQYPYIIVLDNGREVGRAQAQLVDHPDVDRLYPNTNGRQAAGFFADVDIPTYAYGDRLTVIARFSNGPVMVSTRITTSTTSTRSPT